MTISRRRALGAIAAAAALPALTGLPARAADAEVIDARVNLALSKLWEQVPGSQDLAARAKGMLIMPKVTKGGFIVGGAFGEGALRLNNPGTGYGPTVQYYSVSAASVGLQIGIQTTGHALFFLTDKALEKFREADGWEVGADAEVTFPEKGVNIGIDSTSYEKPIVGIVFAEDGLLIGASLEGAKYSTLVR
ncbi:MAG TPA: YSC84-related protein [Thermohalobaculum sp.]|nr:YSC84-related protein [Thermohalobaculum sp.]